MIQLYKPGNTRYENNGDITLHPVKADLQMTLNAEWVLDLEVPQTQEVLENLVHDSVIKFDLPRFKGQLYVVSNPRRTNFETVTAQAYPIALWDARNELVCLDCRPMNQTGSAALQYILDGCGGHGKYSVQSDITKVSTAYYVRKNFIECLASDDAQSFVNRWGGEILFDNRTFIVNEQAGVTRDITLSASRNIAGFTVTEDDSEYCDVIIPVAFNGRTKGTRVLRDERSRVNHVRFVDYQNIRLKEDMSGETDDESLIICDTMEDLDKALQAAAKKSFESGEFLPKYTYDIDYIDLRHYGGYEGMEELTYLWLGDRVMVENLDSRIQTNQKVIKLTYNLVTDEIDNLVLGANERNFFTQMSSTAQKVNAVVSSEGTVIAQKVSGILDAMDVQLRAQKSAAVKQDVRAVLHEDTDPESPTFGATCLGTKGLEIADHRTPDGTDWDWGTAVTAKSIVADYILTGLLSGKRGNFWFNMDTGEFELGRGLFKGRIDTLENANVGKRIYLDYDNDSETAFSGIHLGNKDQADLPRLLLGSSLMNSQQTINQVQLIAKKGDAEITINDWGFDKGAFLTLRSNGRITLETPELQIEKDGKLYTGATYEGIVNNIKTVNGIVTGVS